MKQRKYMNLQVQRNYLGIANFITFCRATTKALLHISIYKQRYSRADNSVTECTANE